MANITAKLNEEETIILKNLKYSMGVPNNNALIKELLKRYDEDGIIVCTERKIVESLQEESSKLRMNLNELFANACTKMCNFVRIR